MFPKAHAAAYVMMAWRIAYCKINYPLAYYAAYFRHPGRTPSPMRSCARGRRSWSIIWMIISRRSDSLSKKEQDTMKDMHIVQEMYARGL